MNSVNPEYRQNLRAELMLRLRFTPILSCEIGHRTTGEEILGWADRYPWLTPQVDWEKRRSQTVVVFQGRLPALDLQINGRTLSERRGQVQDGHLPSRRRSLLGLRADWRLRSGWSVRAGWFGAWGQDVDLVSASSPLPGYVLPRHWGNWSTETFWGITLRRERWRGDLGFSIREPEIGLETGVAWEVVAQVKTSW